MTIKSLINEINAQQHLTDNEKILFVGSALGLIDEIRTALSRDDVNPNCQISWDGSTCA